MKVKIIILLLLFVSIKSFTQNSFLSNSVEEKQKSPFVFWHLISLNGEIKARGEYREQKRWLNNFYDFQKHSYLSGGALINSSSFFLHPNFMILDVNAEYNPSTNKDFYIITPDQSEIRSVRKLGVKTTFLNQKQFTFGMFANFDDSYQNRELLTNIKSVNKQYGAFFTCSNKWFPVSGSVSQRKWEQKELQTNRNYKYEETIIRGALNKSFTLRDRNELSYSHNQYTNTFVNLYSAKNNIDELHLNNQLFFDADKKYMFRSNISDFIQTGFTNYKRIEALENLTFRLPKNLLYRANYNYYNIAVTNNKQQQHSIQTDLEHKLYKSLTSRLFFEYNNIKQTNYKESNYKVGTDFKYSKQIPKGQLNLYYKYYRYRQNVISDPVLLQITREEVYLVDNQIILLKKPYVNLSSIIVQDVTGTVIYQLNIDYSIIERNNFIEIRRLPGGLIANNSTVYVDYTATQPGKYNYESNNHFFTANVLLFKNILEVYYRYSSQNYVNINYTDFLTLNYFHQNVVGTRVNFNFVDFGAEYDNYNSTIIPYQMIRYFVNFQKNFNNKVLVTLSGNQQQYHLINENRYQTFSDVIGKVSYNFIKNTRFNVDLMYRNQKGEGIDLDLITGKAEIITYIRKLYFSFGVEAYKRNYIGEKIYFRGAFIQISRKF